MFGCLAVFIGMMAPRVALVVIWLFTDWPERAFEGWVWPLVGFLFMPYTTLTVLAANLNGGVQGAWIALVVFAIGVDLIHHQGAHKRKRHRTIEITHSD